MSVPSGCPCNAGYSGIIAASTTSPYFTGMCTGVYSFSTTNIEAQVCSHSRALPAQHVGRVSAQWLRVYFRLQWFCQRFRWCPVFFRRLQWSAHNFLVLCANQPSAVPCPGSSSGNSVPAGCACNAGYSGSVSAAASSPYYTSSCAGAAHFEAR
jgi:hypothetical protein